MALITSKFNAHTPVTTNTTPTITTTKVAEKIQAMKLKIKPHKNERARAPDSFKTRAHFREKAQIPCDAFI